MPTTPPSQRCPIAELKAGDTLDDIYRVASKDLRTTNNGSLYIHAIIADRSGQVVARMWNATQALYDSLPEGGLAGLRGRVESYKGRPQLIIDGVRTIEPGTVDASDFLPATELDVEALWKRVVEILRTVESPELKALLAKFIKDPQFAANFKRAPAARGLHHAYLGGLLEHTLNVLELGVLVCPRYPDVSRDLVLVGLFLHDVGKTAELGYETNFDYTNEGQLLGHIVQAVIWIDRYAREIEAETGHPFPPDLLMVLKHIIVSHHGKHEFGSPRLPAMPEAILVHYLDNLDAKVAMMADAVESDPDQRSDWTTYLKALETRIFKPDVLKGRSPS